MEFSKNAICETFDISTSSDAKFCHCDLVSFGCVLGSASQPRINLCTQKRIHILTSASILIFWGVFKKNYIFEVLRLNRSIELTNPLCLKEEIR